MCWPRRHNFSRLPQSQLQCSPQFFPNYHIFKPRAEDFTLSIADKDLPPGIAFLGQKTPFSTGPREAHRVLFAQGGHTAPHLPPPRNASSAAAAGQTSPHMLDVIIKVTVLFKSPPLEHNPFTLSKHFSTGKMTAALERVCNPYVQCQEMCVWESHPSSSGICTKSGLSFQGATGSLRSCLSEGATMARALLPLCRATGEG